MKHPAKLGIVCETAGRDHGRIYAYDKYLKILNEGPTSQLNTRSANATIRRLAVMNLAPRSTGSGSANSPIALPSQLFYSTQMPARLWFLAKNKNAAVKRDFCDRFGFEKHLVLAA